MEFEMRKYTIGEFYTPAMKVQTEEEARDIFEAMVRYSVNFIGDAKEHAEYQERKNIKFMAGFYDNETLLRVTRLFHLETINPYEGE